MFSGARVISHSTIASELKFVETGGLESRHLL